MEVKDFIQEFRDRIGDTSCSVPVTYIISYLNTVLRRFARSEGLERLFEHHDTFELATINKDGTPTAAWDLGKIGPIIDVRELRMLQTSEGAIGTLKPTYKETDEFFKHNPIPEQNPAGYPSSFTIQQVGTTSRLILSCPPCNLVALDALYSAYHPRILDINGKIEISYFVCDLLVDGVIILHKIETTDQSTARALYEDLDLLTTELKELLAKRKTALGYRRVKRSF